MKEDFIVRSEKEKMLAEGLYHPGADELVSIRKNARKLVREINQTHEDEHEKRATLVKQLFGGHKKAVYLEPPFHCDYGENITVGENFYANFDCIMLDVASITIGDNVMFGPRATLCTATHPIDAAVRNSNVELAKAIHIGNNVWFGANVTVNPGVSIGDNVVVGSGAVVTKNIPSNVVAAGNPCKILRDITLEEQAYWQRQHQEYLEECK